jgi:hypothetical protein
MEGRPVLDHCQYPTRPMQSLAVTRHARLYATASPRTLCVSSMVSVDSSTAIRVVGPALFDRDPAGVASTVAVIGRRRVSSCETSHHEW